MSECIAYGVLLVAAGQLAAFALPMRLDAPRRIALGLGLLWTLPLLAFALLRPFGEPTEARLAALLLAFAAGAGALCLRRRSFRSEQLGSALWVLGVGAGVAAAVQWRFAFSYLDSALLYLSYGSYVLESGAEYPLLESYAHRYAYPFLQMKYGLVVPTRLLSSGDPLAYYLYGIPWVSAAVTAGVVYGAFVFFRDHLSRAGATLLTAVFLYAALHDKIFSVRAETMAWLPGFALLIALGRALRADAESRAALWALVAVLFVTTAMLHGVVLVAAVSLGLGAALHALWRHPEQRGRLLAGAGLAGVLAVAGMGALYAALHAPYLAGEEAAFLEIHAESPEPGEIDPGIAFYHLYTQTPPVPGWIRVGDGPPVVSLGRHLELLLLAPLLEPLEAPRAVQLAVVALGLAGLLAWGWRRAAPPGSGALLAGLSLLVLLLLGYSIYLDAISRAWFPWGVGERRLLPYIRAGFCALYLWLPFAWLEARAAGPRGSRALGWIAAVCAALLFFGVTRHPAARSRDQSPYLAPAFLEASRWLREHRVPGARAVANFGTMGQMAYLSGMPFASEGVMPYELHGLMKRNVETLLRTRELMLEPSAARVRDYAGLLGVRYLLLATGPRVPGAPTFLLPDAARPEDFEASELVFRNAEYAILRIDGEDADEEKP